MQEGVWEVSFSRHSQFARLGIGKHLMRILIDWAVQFGAKKLTASTFKRNEPMRALFRKAGFIESQDPDDMTVVVCTADVAELVKRSME